MTAVALIVGLIAGGAITDRWRWLRRPRKHTLTRARGRAA